MPTNTAFLVHRVNENTPDDVTVETGRADNSFAQQGYENLALMELCGDGFRSKALPNLSDNVSRVVL